MTAKENKNLGRLKAKVRLSLLVGLILLPFGLYLALERGWAGWAVLCFALICAAMGAVSWKE